MASGLTVTPKSREKTMKSLIADLQKKRNKLNKRLGVVKSYKAVRSLQRELDHVDAVLHAFGK